MGSRNQDGRDNCHPTTKTAAFFSFLASSILRDLVVDAVARNVNLNDDAALASRRAQPLCF